MPPHGRKKVGCIKQVAAKLTAARSQVNGLRPDTSDDASRTSWLKWRFKAGERKNVLVDVLTGRPSLHRLGDLRIW
jgi:hypothetical protein